MFLLFGKSMEIKQKYLPLELFCCTTLLYSHTPGVGNFFAYGKFQKYLERMGHTFQKTRGKIYIFTESTTGLCKKNATLRAVQKTLAGWIWPAGSTLPTPTTYILHNIECIKK